MPAPRSPIAFSPHIGVRAMPRLDARHASDVPGLFIVGDLADAPVIKVALRQGYEVVDHALEGLPPPEEGVVDVLVVGAGPAGVGAALRLQERGARYLHIEKERPFATIQRFPRSKLIFSEPQGMAPPGGFWFEDARTDALIARWDEALAERALPIRQPEALTALRRVDGRFEVTTTRGDTGEQRRVLARRVILATGRRGSPRRLGVPGEDRPGVHHAMPDPATLRGRRVLVVGGGDSAVEAALDAADAGAEVTLSCRGPALVRPKEKNKRRFEEALAAGGLRFEPGTTLREVREGEVELGRGAERLALPNDEVVVQAGTTLPVAFLKSLGVRMAGELDLPRVAWLLGFAALTWCFYVLKSGVSFSEARGMHVAKRPYWPFGPDHALGAVPDLLHVDLGFRAVDGAFWGTVLYSLVILGFGLRAWRRYPSPAQRRRYASLIGFQWVFLFGVPELVAPALIALGGQGGLAWQLLGGDRPWKLYSLSVPWPLNIWALIDAPGWTATGDALVAALWLALAALVSFVAIPLYVRQNGQRFCSALCGCGGLAETLGDLWRHLAPRGRDARRAEWFGRAVMILALPTTALIAADAWGLLAGGALYDARLFAERWYTLVVDFMLASVLGVALYPYLGNRVWCRFFCPLRAWMEELARRFARVTIRANDKCIGCNECTRYCQMGIDVQAYAQAGRDLDNSDSACIQCGICIEVCPMEVLSLGPRGEWRLAASFGPAVT